MPKYTKTFEITYHADEPSWMNQYNLKMILDEKAPGGKPYLVKEISDPPDHNGIGDELFPSL